MSASTSDRFGDARRAAESSAFDAGHRGAEPHGLDFALAFGQRQRKAAVEGVAGAMSTATMLNTGKCRTASPSR